MNEQIKARRRQLLLALGGSVASQAFGQVDPSATYPDRMIRLINPWTPGGPGETVGRPIADVLTKAWKQSVIIEHKPGANAVLGSAFVAKSPPDGYTILLGQTGPNTISPTVGAGTPYDPIKDFAPITQVTSAGLVLGIRAELPIYSINDLIAYGRAKPGSLTFGSVGNGSTTHLAGEMLKALGNFEMMHVPYKGAVPVLTDLLGGQISMTFLNVAGIVPYMKGDRIRPIAITSLKRSAYYPNIPTIAETLPGFEVTSWYALLAPGGTPASIIEKIYVTVARGLREPGVANVYKEAGQELTLSTPQEFELSIRQEISKWSKLVKENKITAE